MHELTCIMQMTNTKMLGNSFAPLISKKEDCI